jgi:hypothetical protein
MHFLRQHPNGIFQKLRHTVPMLFRERLHAWLCAASAPSLMQWSTEIVAFAHSNQFVGLQIFACMYCKYPIDKIIAML